MFNTKKKAVDKMVEDCRAALVAAELSEAQASQSGDFGFNVLSKIRASTVVIKTEIGTVEVGLTGFQLIFQIANGSVDQDSFPREIDPLSPPAISVQREISSKGDGGIRTTRGFEFGFRTDSVSAETTVDGSSTEESSSSHERVQRDEISFDKSVVTLTNVSSHRFTLSVESPYGENSCINQRIYDARLCYVSPLDRQNKVSIRQSVQIVPRQLRRGSGTGVFGKKVHKNQERLIDRLVAKLVDEEWSLQSLESRHGKAQ